MEPSHFLVLWVILGVIFGAITLSVGDSKNQGGAGAFLLGFFLGPLGWAAMFAAPYGQPKIPEGMKRYRCPRCMQVQNAPSSQPNFECWQCKLVVDVQPTYPAQDGAPVQPTA